LPAPFDGLGLQFNHTWVTTDADLSNTLKTATFTVPGLSENTTNIALFYEKDRISTRVAWNNREGFLTAVPSLHPQYTADYWQLDAGFSYNITDNVSVLFEGINLTDENVDYYNIVGQTSTQRHLSFISNSGRRVQAGIRAQF
jgi:iron complex outermembrane receptor protein